MSEPSTGQPDDGGNPDGGGNDGDGGNTGTGDPDEENPDGGLPTSLSGMTKAELLAYAEEHGVTGVDGKDTKAEIIEAIENA